MRRAPGAVGRVRLFRDDPLEPHLHDLLVERLAVLLEVLEVTERTGVRQDALEDRLALDERQRPHVVPLEPEQVEDVEQRGSLDRSALHLDGTGELGAVLEPLEARVSRLVGHDELGVQHDVVVRQRRDGAGELGERGGDVVAVACDEAGLAALARGADAIAVELELEQPPRLREWLLARLGEHGFGLLDPHNAPRRFEPRQLLLDGFSSILAFLQLLDREPREHRFGWQRTILRNVAVPFLDEEPLFLALLELHQRPLAVQLVAPELEQELPLLHPLVRVLERDPHASVPHDHRAGAVVALGDDPFEVTVLERMVFDVDR